MTWLVLAFVLGFGAGWICAFYVVYRAQRLFLLELAGKMERVKNAAARGIPPAPPANEMK